VDSLVTGQIIAAMEVLQTDIALVVGLSHVGQFNVALQVQIMLELLVT
jgi:hypothetical protein